MKKLYLVVAAAVVACSSPVAPPQVPSNAVEYPALDIYGTWWNEVERDVGIERPMDHVRFFSVEDDGYGWFHPGYQRIVRGLWVPDGRIYVMAYAQRDEALLKHEFLHELLRGDRNHNHPLFDAYNECIGQNLNTHQLCPLVRSPVPGDKGS